MVLQCCCTLCGQECYVAVCRTLPLVEVTVLVQRKCTLIKRILFLYLMICQVTVCRPLILVEVAAMVQPVTEYKFVSVFFLSYDL